MSQRTQQQRQTRREQLRAAQEKAAKEKRLRRWITSVATVLVVVVIGFGLWSARPTIGSASGKAPDFTLQTTTGTSVTLSELRGKRVILYFNEGAGCGSYTFQMAAIEKEPGFAEAGITVLPIVMNTAWEIMPDLATYGVTTPYLLDDGKVSQAYDVLGKGMHAGLPGHGFVLIDAEGNQRWSGDYPSMWLEPRDLLKEATSRLPN